MGASHRDPSLVSTSSTGAVAPILADQRLVASKLPLSGSVFLSVAIPQYNRRRYLERNLESLFMQTFPDFEILVSDDNSPDDSNDIIPELLQQSGRTFQYYAQSTNLGYDGNVRFCLSHARGRYVMLLGNDDALVRSSTLREIADALAQLDYPEVAITNYEDWQTQKLSRRAYSTCIFGSGPGTAVRYFRSFSFVSGLIYDSAQAAKHDTPKWDRSIYYQIYLACRIIASGGRMAGLNISAIRDHIRLDGELVPETYRNRYKNAGWTSKAKHTGLDSVARVVVDAVLPYMAERNRSAAITSIWKQLLLITYPYWILEYRRLANWSWGIAVARDLWPRRRLAEYELKARDRVRLWSIYLAATAAALTIPPGLFTSIRHRLAEFVRRRRQLAR